MARLLRALRALAMTVAISLFAIHYPLSTAFAEYTGGAGDGSSYGESINTGLGGTVAAIISSASDQRFYVGKEPTTAKTITITDTTAGAITSSGDLRIRIPSSFNMTWYCEGDVSDNTFSIGNKPTVTFNSAAELTNGSGKVATSVDVADVDLNDTCRLKVEYSTDSTNGTDGTWLDPTIESGTITADFGTPVLDNAAEYQIGTASGWILTSSGSNTIGFNWLSKTDLSTTDDTSVWLRFTASDGTFISTVVPSTAFSIDNVAPTLTFGYYTDAGCTSSFTNDYMKAGTYYIKISA
ncbi:MAG: hypothetical protein JXM68_05320, partial [Sedimentisphaerales bacterium]|nr:hypothetical protein [Sedimentisphaerales bacterium]